MIKPMSKIINNIKNNKIINNIKNSKIINNIKNIKYILKKKKILEVIPQKILTKEESKELEKVGYVLSRRFKLSLLRKASKLGTSDVGKIGQEVHGYMILQYKNRYQWLLDNDVFDRAITYALRYYNQEIFNVIKDYDFEHAIINIVILSERTWYDEYEDFDFDKVIVLTQGSTLEESILWVDNCVRYDDNGFKILKTVAKCNFLNLGFTLWDKPVLVLKDAVGMDKMFFEAKTNAKQMENIQEQLLKMHIYSKRQEEITMREKMMEKDITILQIREEYQYYKDNIKAHDMRDSEQKLKDFAKKYEDETYNKRKINWRKILQIAGIIIVFVGIIFFISRF